ncbi:LapD/MoxY N-terminal periplasmic domain-containing protein [Litorivivens sp.]|uniref:bifunctional diguanylate cyclase/phosphodiesterase n=3 Tax=Litorivivens sp. TaxID=2020868 RepID=UPI003565E418
MTIYRQIAGLIAAGLLLLFLVISFDAVRHSTNVIKSQMATSAQDAATVVAISLSVNEKIDDLAAIETLSNAVFDSGYYSSIRLLTNDGALVYEKRRPLASDGVPDWFTESVKLGHAVGEAEVRSGWSSVGRVQITLHPGFAYADLYSRISSSLMWFGAAFLALILVLWALLHLVLSPLRRIEQQANAIQHNDFVVQERLPRTQDLRRVVEMVNRLSMHVRRVFEEQHMLWQNHQKLLFVDPLTELPNRRRLLSKAEFFLSDKNREHASLLVIKLNDYANYRVRHGHAQADEMLVEMARMMKDSAPDGTVLIGRLSDIEFGILLRDRVEGASQWARDLFAEYQRRYGKALTRVELSAASTALQPGKSLSGVLSEIDLLLATADAGSAYQSLTHHSTGRRLPEGNSEWFSWFTRVLADRRVYLEAQPVFDRNYCLVHREMLVRIQHDDGAPLEAGLFMPMAEKLGFSQAIYARVREMMSDIAGRVHDAPIAMNFPELFLSDLGEMAHLLRILAVAKKRPGSLLVEVPYHAAVRDLESVTRVAKQVRLSGQLFGIDHFDLEYPIATLQEISPDYVKVSARLLKGITADGADDVYATFRNLTATLNINVIAVGIDKASLLEHLQLLDVDGLQGNLLGKPESFE